MAPDRQTSRHAQPKLFGPVDIHMVALMRCLLASVAIVATLADWQSTGAILIHSVVAYGVYSIALCIAIFRGFFANARTQPWIDAFFYVYLIALTRGSESIFFHFVVFPMVTAAFLRGFREGLAVTMFSVISFVSISLAGDAHGMQFDLTHAASRTISLFILGYLVSYWGGTEFALRRRLSLLRELATTQNPHNTLDGLVRGQLRRLLEFFQADSALIALPAPGTQTCRLYRAERAKPGAAAQPGRVSEELGNALLRPVGATSYDAQRWWRRVRAPQGSDPALNGRSFHNVETDCAELANLLETRSFACVPYSPNDALVGRLYIMSSSKSFSNADTQFLAHVARQMASAANNGLVTEALAVSAAQHERSKISRDIHDTTVQSYIGLKLGLEALYRDMGIDGPAASRIKELLDMATLTVDDLRGYVERLRERESQQGDAKLLARIDEQRRRFETLHGIQVKVRADEALALPDGAAGTQAYQVVCEALSNIVRHTSAKQAFVDLRCNGETLAIEVGNDCAQNQRTAAFIPRSITERAVSLGGKVQVRLNNQGQDVVRVTIPLGAKLQLAAYAG